MHEEKRKKGRGLCWLLFSFLFSLLSVNLAMAGDLKPKIAPFNPAFIKYIKSVNNGTKNTDNHHFGLIPNPFKLSPHKIKKSNLLRATSTSLPSKYDLRDYGLVTLVKDQGKYGTCWAFATYGALESDVLKTFNESYDFSEDNLVNGVFIRIGFNTGDYGFNYGGNILMSSAYLTDGYGPVLESCDPYPNLGTFVQCQRNRYIENIVFLPPRANATDNDYLKEAIYNHGALYTSMLWCDEAYDDNSTTYYYHGQSCSSSNEHAVVIVGWDDNKYVPGAPGKGAWIVRNSWGPNWGDNGYFYVSYYDTEFAKDINAYFDDKPDINNGNFVIYQYDKFGMCGDIGGVDHIYGANIFKASNNQTIKAVSLFIGDAPTNYVINVYKNCDNVTKIATLSPDTTQQGTINESGYHTINLNTPVSIEKGSFFTVEAELTPDNSSEYPLGIEEKVSSYSDNATCNKGESFISTDGKTWNDLCDLYSDNGSYSTNVCLKAIAVPTSQPPVINSFTADPTSGDAPLKVTFNCNAIDPDGQVTAYKWDFDGDGKVDQTTNSSSISYTYQKPGTYNAKVTVVDNDGAEASKTVSITVTSLNQPPVINSFTADPTSGDAPLKVSFDWNVSDQDNDPLTCTLDFGDGSNWSGSCGSKPQTHTYNSAGSYTAKLTVDDGNGGTASKTLTITANQPQPVNHPPMISSFTCTPKEGNAPLKVACTLNATDPDNDPLHYTYMFGDGQSSTENPTIHTYTAVGTYDIKACACDNKGACTCRDEQITVNPNPSPQIQNFTVSPRKGIAPLTVTFDVTATDRTITNYTFDFGDGKTQTTTNSTIIHTYSEPGIYSATVSVIDDYDNTVTSDPIQIQVGDRKTVQTGNGTVATQTEYSQIRQLVSQEPQCQMPEGEQAPYGSISFKLNLSQGATQDTVAITFPSSIEGMKVYKYVNGQLMDITGQVSISGNTLTLTLIDNGQFDQNQQKGIIEDPIILTQKTSQPKPQPQSSSGGGEATNNSSSGGGGGGCSMSPVPSTGRIFTYLLMLSSLIGLKFRRRE